MENVYIIDSLRTPVGKYGGALSSVRPDDMAALVIDKLMEKSSLEGHHINDVIVGCANQAGEDNRNIARMAALLAGLPETVPGVTVNRLCASSLEAIIQGARAIKSGEVDIIIAGGVESMSRAPYSIPKNVSGSAMFGNLTAYDTALGWRYPNKEMEKMFPLESMGETAENVAERWGISREEQDSFAFASHQKAATARDNGVLAEEITPVPVAAKKGEFHFVEYDETIRPDTSIEKLAKLSPAFRKGGSVTAGNSSSLNDGAAMVLMASESAVKRHNLTPIARYISSAAVGVDPRFMGIGPVYAIRSLLSKTGMSIEDIGLFEINEAFAAQALACQKELSISNEQLNINGGAIAIGHPLGMSGARISGSLIRSMQRHNHQFGIASLCIGVGQGLAVLYERV